MSNSPLVTHTKISPNRTSPRNHKIDTISIHCAAGQLTAKELLDLRNFTTYDPKRGSSCNYAIGKDGSIGMGVEEKDRSWCTSSSSNDHRAITIEVASDSKPPYKVTDKAYSALIELLTDICKRNHIKKLKWKGDKSLIGNVSKQNMTVHKWFANKDCPGEYLYTHHADIVDRVNSLLSKKEPYLVKISITYLNIRKGPGTNYETTGKCTGRGVFTIVDTTSGPGSKSGWGKLKSGAGWISLDYARKL